jgi:hypothetical protein
VPSAILLGAAIVPAAFLTFVYGRRLPYDVSPPVVLTAAFLGGIIGTVVAGTLEYDAQRDLGFLPMVGVGLIEETSKLIIPLAVLIFFARYPQAGRRAAHRRRGGRRVRRAGDDGLRVRHADPVEGQHHRHGRRAALARHHEPGRAHGVDRHLRHRAVRRRRGGLERAPRRRLRGLRSRRPSPCTRRGTARSR